MRKHLHSVLQQNETQIKCFLTKWGNSKGSFADQVCWVAEREGRVGGSMSRESDFYPMWYETVAGTWLEAIKHERYWELESSSTHLQRQAESAGVGMRSEMSQEARDLGRFSFYIRMKIDTFPSCLCLCWCAWWECCSEECPEELPSLYSFTIPLQPCSSGQHHPGQNGVEESWLCKLPALEVGAGATTRVWGLLLFPVFGGGLPCTSSKAKT